MIVVNITFIPKICDNFLAWRLITKAVKVPNVIVFFPKGDPMTAAFARQIHISNDGFYFLTFKVLEFVAHKYSFEMW